MIIDLKKLGDYWQVTSIIMSLVVALTYFVIENKQANATINALSEANKTLTEKVQKLEGHTEGVDHAIQLFMENQQGLINYRVELLEKQVFGSTNVTSAPKDTAKVVMSPPKIN